ncbi:hypothetical protein R1sor_000426 [Riccia sorocarpa]|uniref:Altered inheritance of mitochondria protein 24, mitochondrial n=1 Tax=Riccia sorocarpa TaxID=122646 RepID=A0ABD3GX24_9MARC
MYNNNAQPPYQPPGEYPPAAYCFPASVPPADYGARYQQGPPQQSFSQHSSGPPMYPPPTAPGGNFPGPPPAVPTAYPMDAYSISQFVANTQAAGGNCPFEVDKTRPAMLQINFGCQSTVGGSLQQVYIKKGSMVGYRGEVKFEREGMLEHGIGHMLKKAMTSEGASLVKATAKGGKAQLYCADDNKMVTVLQLQGEAISVNGDDMLAFEPSLDHKIVMLKKMSSIVSGGLFNVKLSGKGCVAILSHGKPLTLVVRKDQPIVFTDPQATVAWSGSLTPDFNTDVQFKTLFGRGSGESFQMKFDPKKGEGFVVIQPYEEIPEAPSSGAGSGNLISAIILETPTCFARSL